MCLRGPVLQVIESVDAVPGFSCTCLRRASHPFQLASQYIADLVSLCVVVGNPFFSFFKIVLIVASVGVYGPVVHFHYRIAHFVEEIPVVRHHKQGAP